MFQAHAENADAQQAGTNYARVIITTAANSKYFDLLRDLLMSIAEHRGGRDVALGCYDLGFTDEQRDWLRARGVRTVVPRTELRIPEGERDVHKLAYAARPFLRENFPDHEIYVWLDADLWLQDWNVIDRLIEGARRHGAAIARENERGYRFQAWLFMWTAKHFIKGYGFLSGLWLLTRPHINNGVFAMRADAPHWQIWRRLYQRAVDRSGQLAPHDQFALNEAIYRFRLPTAFLPATCNWICDRGIPMWNEVTNKYCAPYAPYAPISIMHLAGPAKSQIYEMRIVGDGRVRAGLRYRASRTPVVAAPRGWVHTLAAAFASLAVNRKGLRSG
jgi:hypothetical protein